MHEKTSDLNTDHGSNTGLCLNTDHCSNTDHGSNTDHCSNTDLCLNIEHSIYNISTNSIISNLNNNTDNLCRICYDPVVVQKKFCLCEGTIANIHEACLLRWLETNNLENCEICKYKINMTKYRKIDYRQLVRLLLVIILLNVFVIFRKF